MCCVECLAVDEYEKESGGEESPCAAHDVAGEGEADPREGDAEGEDRSVRDPDAEAEELEEREVDEAGAWRGELEEVLKHTAAFEHVLGVQPDEDLVAAQQDGREWKREEVEVEIHCGADQHQHER
jgi:hypothetical protein